jgi:hypothetical protein
MLHRGGAARGEGGREGREGDNGRGTCGRRSAAATFSATAVVKQSGANSTEAVALIPMVVSSLAVKSGFAGNLGNQFVTYLSFAYSCAGPTYGAFGVFGTALQ